MTLIQLRQKRPPYPDSITSFQSYVACPRKFNLERKGEGSSSTSADVGTMLHAYLERYFSGKPETQLSFEPAPTAQMEHDVARVFQAFKARRSRHCFGKVIATELTLTGPAIEEALGAKPFKCTIDLVCKLAAKDCAGLALTDNLDLEPGIYIIDHKSSASGGGQFLERQMMNLQYHAYQLAWNAEYPKTKCVGAICNGLITTKMPQFPLVQISAPKAHDVAALQSLFEVAALFMQHRPDAAIATSCMTYGVCEQYINGSCNRA